MGWNACLPPWGDRGPGGGMRWSLPLCPHHRHGQQGRYRARRPQRPARSQGCCRDPIAHYRRLCRVQAIEAKVRQTLSVLVVRQARDHSSLRLLGCSRRENRRPESAQPCLGPRRVLARMDEQRSPSPPASSTAPTPPSSTHRRSSRRPVLGPCWSRRRLCPLGCSSWPQAAVHTAPALDAG